MARATRSTKQVGHVRYVPQRQGGMEYHTGPANTTGLDHDEDIVVSDVRIGTLIMEKSLGLAYPGNEISRYSPSSRLRKLKKLYERGRGRPKRPDYGTDARSMDKEIPLLAGVPLSAWEGRPMCRIRFG